MGVTEHVTQSLFLTSHASRREVMTSELLESRSADDVDLRVEPVSSVLAAYRHQTSATPYWPTASHSADVIMTSYGVGGTGYVVHSGPPGLVSPWMVRPSLSAGCYGSCVPAALSPHAGSVELQPWTVNGYVPSPPSAVSPPFQTLHPLTGWQAIHDSFSNSNFQKCILFGLQPKRSGNGE